MQKLQNRRKRGNMKKKKMMHSVGADPCVCPFGDIVAHYEFMIAHCKNIVAIICTIFAFAAHAQTVADRTSVGVKLGLNFPYMSYSEGVFDDYSSKVYIKPQLEIFGQYEFTPRLSIRPGIKFITRGEHIDEADFLYRLNADYTELTIPIVYTFGTFKGFRPYLIDGIEFGILRGGVVRYSSASEGTYQTGVGKGSMSSFNFGLYLGGGVNYPLTVKGISIVPGFEAGYHFGLTDTYSQAEKDGSATTINASSYKASGTRKTRGIELGLTLSVPLGQWRAKDTVRADTATVVRASIYRAPVADTVEQDTTPPQQDTTVTDTITPPPPPPPQDTVDTKALAEAEEELIAEVENCHSLEDLKKQIEAGENIQNKKLCTVSQISFEFGSFELRESDKAYLDGVVDLLNRNEKINLRVNGHSDNIGEADFNMYVSKERAKAVHDYLIEKGIDKSRLSFVYFGSRRPLRSNATEEGRTINRRVEFEVLE
jgi:OOP family OmpA-OmpF porin